MQANSCHSRDVLCIYFLRVISLHLLQMAQPSVDGNQLLKVQKMELHSHVLRK